MTSHPLLCINLLQEAVPDNLEVLKIIGCVRAGRTATCRNRAATQTLYHMSHRRRR